MPKPNEEGKEKKGRKEKVESEETQNVQEEIRSHLLGVFNSGLIKYGLFHARQFWFIYTFLFCI